jgi:tetratricopeptide (TPR) repeat protein
MDAKFANAYSNRAATYHMVGSNTQALADARKSLELRPRDVATLVTRGSILEALGRREEAIADFREALLLYPEGRKAKDALKRLDALP